MNVNEVVQHVGPIYFPDIGCQSPPKLLTALEAINEEVQEFNIPGIIRLLWLNASLICRTGMNWST